jgi:hypothetical protein
MRSIERLSKKSDRVLAGSFNQRATQYPEFEPERSDGVHKQSKKVKKGMT